VRLLLALLGVFHLGTATATYDADGVLLGGNEKDIKKRYPSAHCKELEWKSKAADRRCDDAKVRFGGLEARITFYLRKGVVEAFDLRFATKDTDRLAKYLKARYGQPFSEEREAAAGKATAVHKILWEAKGERALLTSVPDKRRGSLFVTRGDFENEIYRVQ
jgi:hypothetical protein